MNDCQKLEKLISEADVLIAKRCNGQSSELLSWKKRCRIFIASYYSEENIVFKEFSQIHYLPQYFNDYNSAIPYTLSQLSAAKSILEDMLMNMKDKSSEKIAMNSNSVFIVHGHDEALKYKVSNLLRKIGLDPIILHEQTNSCITIIEKIEKHGAEAGAAIILFTPDDTGKANKETDYKNRARQNVVFEAGFFIGLLGRERTMIIKSDDSVELPGDLSGIVYSGTSELEIARELKHMGFNVDLNEI